MVWCGLFDEDDASGQMDPSPAKAWTGVPNSILSFDDANVSLRLPAKGGLWWERVQLVELSCGVGGERRRNEGQCGTLISKLVN